MNLSLQQITQLLQAWRDGKESALDELMPLVYDELRSLAQRYLARQAPGQTLQTTALVHEAYERLGQQQQPDYQNRAHFFAVCALMMRRILVDHYRRRRATVALDEVEIAAPESDVDLLALDEALTRLAALDPRAVRVVELHFFGGLTFEEVAEVLQLSPITVKRDWKDAKGWLYQELSREEKQ